MVTDIRGPQRMNSVDFGDPLTFPLVPSLGQTFLLSNTLVHDQILAKLMTFPSANVNMPASLTRMVRLVNIT